MLLVGAATLIGLVFEPLGRVVRWGACVWLTWTIRVVEWPARFPYASIPLKLSDLGLVLVYAVIGGLTVLMLPSLERRQALWESIRARLRLEMIALSPEMMMIGIDGECVVPIRQST